MANTNDERILELKKQIKAKKDKLGKSSRFTPVTNCSIEVDGIRHNIQVLDKDQLIALMVKLNAYALSAKDLDVLYDYMISGYNVQEWISDIKSRIDILSKKHEEKTLKIMEDKLVQLLSERKKVELEIDEIESMLNN